MLLGSFYASAEQGDELFASADVLRFLQEKLGSWAENIQEAKEFTSTSVSMDFCENGGQNSLRSFISIFEYLFAAVEGTRGKYDKRRVVGAI